MKNWTNKKIISIGLGLTVGFFIVELFNDPINWFKPIVSGIIATGLIWIFKLVMSGKSSGKNE